jgi:uncharacterized protein (TIGR02246 family)
MRSSWIISPIIAIGLAASALAGQQVDQNTRQQIEQISATYHDAWNNHNAAEISDLYTNDGVVVTDRTAGAKKGRKAIEAYYVNVFNRMSHQDSATVDEIFPLGNNAVITVGRYHISGQGQGGAIKSEGYYTTVDVLEGGKWRIRMLTAVSNPPPAQSSAR